MMALRRALLLLAWLLPLAAVQPAAASVEDAQALVRQTTDEVLSRLKREREQLKAHPEQIYGLVEDVVLPHFDFRRMSQWVLGKNWRAASEAQRSRFVEEFRNLLVRTYATALLEYTDQKIEYLPLRAAPDAKDVTVRTEIGQPGSPPIPLFYRMYESKQGWKVYDISVDGVSLVTNYRSSFASEIRQGGIDGLINSLAARNKESRTGA